MQSDNFHKVISGVSNQCRRRYGGLRFQNLLDELEATKQKLEASIIREEIRKPLFTRDQIRCFISSFRDVDTNTLDGKRRLIDRFVNSIVVYDDDILVTINYKDKTKRITFKESESSDLSSLGGPVRIPVTAMVTGIFLCFSAAVFP